MRKGIDFKMWFSLAGSAALVLAAAVLMTAGVSQLSRRTEEEGAPESDSGSAQSIGSVLCHRGKISTECRISGGKLWGSH